MPMTFDVPFSRVVQNVERYKNSSAEFLKFSDTLDRLEAGKLDDRLVGAVYQSVGVTYDIPCGEVLLAMEKEVLGYPDISTMLDYYNTFLAYAEETCLPSRVISEIYYRLGDARGLLGALGKWVENFRKSQSVDPSEKDERFFRWHEVPIKYARFLTQVYSQEFNRFLAVIDPAKPQGFRPSLQVRSPSPLAASSPTIPVFGVSSRNRASSSAPPAGLQVVPLKPSLPDVDAMPNEDFFMMLSNDLSASIQNPRHFFGGVTDKSFEKLKNWEGVVNDQQTQKKQPARKIVIAFFQALVNHSLGECATDNVMEAFDRMCYGRDALHSENASRYAKYLNELYRDSLKSDPKMLDEYIQFIVNLLQAYRLQGVRLLKDPLGELASLDIKEKYTSELYEALVISRTKRLNSRRKFFDKMTKMISGSKSEDQIFAYFSRHLQQVLAIETFKEARDLLAEAFVFKFMPYFPNHRIAAFRFLREQYQVSSAETNKSRELYCLFYLVSQGYVECATELKVFYSQEFSAVIGEQKQSRQENYEAIKMGLNKIVDSKSHEDIKKNMLSFIPLVSSGRALTDAEFYFFSGYLAALKASASEDKPGNATIHLLSIIHSSFGVLMEGRVQGHVDQIIAAHLEKHRKAEKARTAAVAAAKARAAEEAKVAAEHVLSFLFQKVFPIAPPPPPFRRSTVGGPQVPTAHQTAGSPNSSAAVAAAGAQDSSSPRHR